MHVNVPYRSSAKVRAICRAPAIILLTRAILLIVGMIVRMTENKQAASASPKYYYSIKNAFEIHSQTTHADVLWSCFVATCIACANESFIRALDHEWVQSMCLYMSIKLMGLQPRFDRSDQPLQSRTIAPLPFLALPQSQEPSASSSLFPYCSPVG